jgi:COG4 transport protein
MSADLKSLLEKLSTPLSLSQQSESLTKNFSSLMQRLESVSSTINSISEPVSILETQRHNTKQALTYLEDIILYNLKLKELSSALKSDNIPCASILCGEISKIPVHIPLQDTLEFTKLKQEVTQKVKKKFGEALTDNNKEIIELYAGLFTHLELGREGIERYIGYIAQSLESQFNNIQDLIVHGSTYEDTLIKIYRITVKTYEGQQENLIKEFGMIGNLELLQKLQHIVDSYAVKIIDNYFIEINKNKSSGLCEEISKIIKHSESFENYLNKLGKNLVARMHLNLSEIPVFGKLDDKYSQETGLLKMSEIKGKILELADKYISLESQQLELSISSLLSKLAFTSFCEKNCQSKEPLVIGPNFEILDECFFIIQKAAQRGLGTLNINSICAILNNIATLISEVIIEELVTKLPSIKIPWSSQFNASVCRAIVGLNLINSVKKCIKKLVFNLEQQFNKIFGGEGSDIIMFKNCLASISDSELKSKKIIDKAISTYMKSLQLSQLLINFRSLSYDISLEMHADYEVNDPFAFKLLKELKALMKQWKLQLVPELFEYIADMISEDLAKLIEQDIKSKRFNELGALQFQKDIREILTQLQNLSNKPIRHRFARLKQISELLMAKEDSEVVELLKDSECKLSDKEMKGYRSLRII